MPTTDRKSNDEVKINSGDVFCVKDGATDWENLGHVMSGKLFKKAGSVEGMYKSGFKWKKRGSVEGGGEMILGQVSKAILDRVDELVGKILKFYDYNGLGDDGNHMEIYGPEIEIIEAMELEMAGEKQQVIALSFSFLPQDGMASCTPDTDLPDEAYAEGDDPVAGTNPFWVILETVAA
jgi:hypothetical protein